MSRVIRGEAGAARRNRRLREIATALRYAAAQDPGPEEAGDLIAFILLALKEIDDTVHDAARAWEKRDYWVKADRFRHRWAWVSQAAAELERAIALDDQVAARDAALRLTRPMKGVKPYKSKDRRPWRGARTDDRFARWRSGQNNANSG